VRFFEAEDLFAEIENIGAVWVRGSGGDVATVIDGINRGERVGRRKYLIEAKSAEIFANRLQWGAEIFRDAEGLTRDVKFRSTRRRCRPKIQERLHAGRGGSAGIETGNKGDGSLVEILTEAFVIAKKKGFILDDGATRRNAELITLERRWTSLVEIIG